VALDGLAEPPPGEAVLVLSRRASLFGFWRRPRITQTAVAVEPLDD
jgi:hypothetical protein